MKENTEATDKQPAEVITGKYSPYFTEEDIATFKAAAVLITEGCPTIDVMSVFKCPSQKSRPITEEEWEAFREKVFKGVKKNTIITSPRKEESKEIASPLYKSPLNKDNPVTAEDAKLRFTAVDNLKVGSLLIPSQTCLKRKYRKVSSFLDKDGGVRAAFLAGIAAIKEAKEREKVKTEKAKTKTTSGKKLDERKIYKQKPKAKPEQSKEPPVTPPKRITKKIPMAPHRKKPIEDDSMEETYTDE